MVIVLFLSDTDMRRALEKGDIKIDPLDPDAIGPCSIDLRLDSVFRVYDPGPPVDIRNDKELDKGTRLVDTKNDPFMILPGQFILGQTIETMSVTPGYAGLLEGKSSVARIGIIVHSAGLVNPGTGMRKPGKLTLEIYCMNLSPVYLYPGMQIVQIMFVPLSTMSTVGYDDREESRYVGQDQPRIR